MQELVDLFINNGVAVACLLYFMWFNSSMMGKLTDALNSINTRLVVIEDRLGIEVGDVGDVNE